MQRCYIYTALTALASMPYQNPLMVSYRSSQIQFQFVYASAFAFNTENRPHMDDTINCGFDHDRTEIKLCRYRGVESLIDLVVPMLTA